VEKENKMLKLKLEKSSEEYKKLDLAFSSMSSSLQKKTEKVVDKGEGVDKNLTPEQVKKIEDMKAKIEKLTKKVSEE
jgi:F0F1-type ATP synthase alpha subunit